MILHRHKSLQQLLICGFKKMRGMNTGKNQGKDGQKPFLRLMTLAVPSYMNGTVWKDDSRWMFTASQKMLVLNCSTKLQNLEHTLIKYFPESLKVYGAVLNINRGNPFKKEVVVDSWPEFKAVITRRQREAESDDLDCFTNAYAVFYKDLQAYSALLEDPETINWEQVFQIQGLQDGLFEVSKAVAGPKLVDVKQSSFQMVIHPDPDALPEVKLKLNPAPRLASLTASHASLLNETWSRGGSEQCRKYLASLICCFPSVCVLDENGSPISWGLTDQFATMIHGYTLPEHRRKGYSRLIATTLAKKLHSRGFPAQGNVLEDNLPSITLLKSMNAHFLPCSFVRLTHTPVQFLAAPHLYGCRGGNLHFSIV